MIRTVTLGKQTVDYAAAVNLMDNDLREQLHASMVPCSPQEFMDAYAAAHAERFGADFVVN
jgi:hypothetical protein